MIVYRATNKINGKHYIGYTTGSLHDRMKSHVRKANDKNQKAYNYFFQRALRKYSINSFIWEVLCICKSKEDCCNKEKEYIKQYNSIAPNGYNLTQGGDGGIQSNITRLKMSITLKKLHKDHPEKFDRMLTMTSENRSSQAKKAWETKKLKGYKAKTGYKFSNESKQKMSITKNIKNKCAWINVNTNEIIYKSLTDMSIHTGLTIGVFNHIKQKRQEKTKCGWMLHKT